MGSKHWNSSRPRKSASPRFICHLNYYIAIISSFRSLAIWLSCDSLVCLSWWTEKDENEMEISWYNRWLNSRACISIPSCANPLWLCRLLRPSFSFLTHVRINSQPIVPRIVDEGSSLTNRRKMVIRCGPPEEFVVKDELNRCNADTNGRGEGGKNGCLTQSLVLPSGIVVVTWSTDEGRGTCTKHISNQFSRCGLAGCLGSLSLHSQQAMPPHVAHSTVSALNECTSATSLRSSPEKITFSPCPSLALVSHSSPGNL